MASPYTATKGRTGDRFSLLGAEYAHEEFLELLALCVVLFYLCIIDIRSMIDGNGNLIEHSLYQGFVPYAIVGCGIILLGPLAPRARLTILTLTSIATLLKSQFHLQPLIASEHSFGHLLLATTALANVGYLLAGNPTHRRECRRALIRGELLLGGVLVSTLGMSSLNHLNPTYDSAIFNIDRHLWIRVPTLLMRLVKASPALHSVVSFVYANVPTAIGLYDVLSTRYRRRPSMTFLFLLSGYVGYLCYHIVPSAGPPFLAPNYYRRAWAARRVLLPPTSVITAPTARNCMPSLHATWAYLILANITSVRRAIGRFALIAASLITIIAALTIGKHWLLDLIVALPFTVSINALFSRFPPLSRPRMLIGMVGTIVVASWFWMIRTNSLAYLSVDWTWLVIAATGGVSALLLWICARVPDTTLPDASRNRVSQMPPATD